VLCAEMPRDHGGRAKFVEFLVFEAD